MLETLYRNISFVIKSLNWVKMRVRQRKNKANSQLKSCFYNVWRGLVMTETDGWWLIKHRIDVLRSNTAHHRGAETIGGVRFMGSGYINKEIPSPAWWSERSKLKQVSQEEMNFLSLEVFTQFGMDWIRTLGGGL